MNKQEILEQGWLEAYLTGDTTHTERNEIERFIASDTEVRAHYEQWEQSLQQLAFAHAVAPKPETKAKLMANVSATGRQPAKKGRQLALPVWRSVAAASIIFALVSGLLAWVFWQNWQNTEGRYSELATRNQALADNLQQTRNELEGTAEQLTVASDPAYRRVILQGTENAPEASAVVYWQPGTRQVYLGNSSLAQLGQGQQYQLWALVDGQPVDAGVFNAGDDFSQMKEIAQADAFAVTVEPAGGSKAPTLSTLQVLGKVS